MVDVAVVGPGSIGSFFAAQLTAAGIDTLACARRPFARYLIESTVAPVDAPAHVVTDPGEVAAPVPSVLLTVKAHQTGAARPWLDRLCGDGTRLVVVQNGVEQAVVRAGRRHGIPTPLHEVFAALLGAAGT